jgi:hypothetical protein
MGPGFRMAIFVDFLFQEETQNAIQTSGDAVIVVFFKNQNITDLTVDVVAATSGSWKEGCVYSQSLSCHLLLLCHRAKVFASRLLLSVPPYAVTLDGRSGGKP